MKLKLPKRLRLIQHKIRRFLSRKISNRLILTYVALAALPLLSAGLIIISLTKGTVQTYIYERNMETARRAGNEISLFLKEPLTILQTTALTRDIVEMDRFSQSNIINKIKDENPIFRKIFVLNDSGYVSVTTRFGEENQNLSKELFFVKGIAGLEHFSDVQFTPSRFPLLSIAEPIIKYDQTVGVLGAEIDLNRIWALVDSITIGKTGFAFLLNNDGRIIAHRDKNKVLNHEDYSKYPFFQNLQSNKEGISIFKNENKDFLLVYVTVPNFEWGVVVQQSQEEAFTLASQLQLRVLYFTALAIVIAIVLGIFGVRRFTKPLLQLVKGAREYGGGNLKHKIEIKTGDELAQLAQEFNSMANSLLKNQKELRKMERLEALSRFAGMISHEIRNPLNAMNINMQILKRAIKKPEMAVEKKMKYVEVISSEITRINDMVTNFLAIARPPELSLIRADIHKALQEVLLLQKAQASAQKIKLHFQQTSGPINGMFDYNQLKQVFHNIIINAFEALETGGVLTITTTTFKKSVAEKDKNFFVKIEFTDNGKGIPSDIIKEVFEFYYSTKQAGSGLGLAIAKQIVEGHQGVMYIESKIGTGTSIFVELPIYDL